jgi:hypothetical protein
MRPNNVFQQSYLQQCCPQSSVQPNHSLISNNAAQGAADAVVVVAMGLGCKPSAHQVERVGLNSNRTQPQRVGREVWTLSCCRVAMGGGQSFAATLIARRNQGSGAYYPLHRTHRRMPHMGCVDPCAVTRTILLLPEGCHSNDTGEGDRRVSCRQNLQCTTA